MRRHSTQAPRGRSELLLWINSLCSSEYPSVESLRDGAAYCTTIDASVQRIAQNCVSCRVGDADEYVARAKFASEALSKVDWSPTPYVCESVDPHTDSQAVKAGCLKNMQLLQDMLRRALPTGFSTEIDVNRLATGKLQDHVKLLQWLFQFMSKVLDQFTKEALMRRARNRTSSGDVEGVKLTRSMRLLEQERNRQANRSDEETLVPHTLGSTPPPLATGSPHHGTGVAPSPRTHSAGGATRKAQAAREAAAAPPTARVTPRRTTSARAKGTTTTHTKPVESSDNVPAAPAATTSVAATTNYRKEQPTIGTYVQGSTTVIAEQKNLLLDLRHEVEEVEALVLNAQENHQFNLTRGEGTTARHVPRAELQPYLTREEFLPAAHTTVPLQELGELLEERDRLLSQYTTVETILQRYRDAGSHSPLLETLWYTLYPS